MAMDLNAKAAYIRGMMKGMEFDPTTQEGKIIVAMMDLLEEMADVVSEHDDAWIRLLTSWTPLMKIWMIWWTTSSAMMMRTKMRTRMTTAHLKPAMKSPAPTAVPQHCDEDTLMDSDKIVCAECGAAFDVEVLPDDARCPPMQKPKVPM